jgi:hypothetical protein
MNKFRLDVQGCNECYNHHTLNEMYNNPHFCTSYKVEGGSVILGNIPMLQILYRFCEDDLTVRPSWCPLNED